MVCYVCGGSTDVFNSRPLKRLGQVWRRRRCKLCDAAFTTLEALDYSRALVVARPRAVGRRLALEPFSRDRLMISVWRSLAHRPAALADAGALADSLSAKLAASGQGQPLEIGQIIRTTTLTLTRFDKLAAQHYAALHGRQSQK